jgi:hypothetical protein
MNSLRKATLHEDLWGINREFLPLAKLLSPAAGVPAENPANQQF